MLRPDMRLPKQLEEEIRQDTLCSQKRRIVFSDDDRHHSLKSDSEPDEERHRPVLAEEYREVRVSGKQNTVIIVRNMTPPAFGKRR